MEAIKDDKDKQESLSDSEAEGLGNVQELTTRGNGSDDAGTQRLR